MKAWRIAILGVLLGAASLTSATRQAIAEGDLFMADPDLRLYLRRDQCCGIVASFIVLNERGFGKTLNEIGQNLPVSLQGTTMNDLADYLRQAGLNVDAVKMSQPTLLKRLATQPELHAIALFDGNHWMVVRASDSGEIVYYDYPDWSTLNSAATTRVFSGDALLVSQYQDPADLNGRFWSVVISLTVATACVLAYLKFRTRESPASTAGQ